MKGRPKSHLNNDFFSCSKPEYSYILGWLMADGYVNPKCIKLSILKEDADEIYNIMFDVGFWNIYNYTPKKVVNECKEQTVFHIRTQESAQNLLNLNYLSKDKTMPREILNKIPSSFLHLFLRGLFDGDGCWYYQPKKLRQFSVFSNRTYDWIWLKTICLNLGIKKISTPSRIMNKGKTKKDGSVYGSSCLRITNYNDIKILGDYIYKDNLHLKLSRKYNKYLQIVNSKS